RPGPSRRPISMPRRRRSPRAWPRAERLSEMAFPVRPSTVTSPSTGHANLFFMATEHLPVLAPELTALLDPHPGQLAIDCTFGAGGHARRVAEGLGPSGTLICIDRDPDALARYEAFSADAPCQTRFISSDFAAGLRALHGEGMRPDMVYMDLG